MSNDGRFEHLYIFTQKVLKYAMRSNIATIVFNKTFNTRTIKRKSY